MLRSARSRKQWRMIAVSYKGEEINCVLYDHDTEKKVCVTSIQSFDQPKSLADLNKYNCLYISKYNKK